MNQLNLQFHLKECKWRFFYLFLTWILFFLPAFFLGDLLFSFFVYLIPGARSFVFTEMSEALTAYFLLAFYWSLIWILPIFYYHLFVFLKPGLHPGERTSLKSTLIFSYILFLLAHSFTYYGLLPTLYNFFLDFETNSIIDLSFAGKIHPFVALNLQILWQTSLIFQFPLFLFSMLRLSLLKLESLVKQRKFFLVLAFILGALLSPPDVGSQILLVLPLIFSFEITIFLAYWIQNCKRERWLSG